MNVRETDPTLRRIERDTRIVCLGFAVVTVVVSGGRYDVPLGVLGGGVLISLSYWAIKGAVDAVAARSARPVAVSPARRRRRFVWMMVRFVSRYALLGGIAYVMIARLGVHPVGLLVGVSSVVAAVAIEGTRVWCKPRAAS